MVPGSGTAGSFCNGAPKMCSTFAMLMPRTGRLGPDISLVGAADAVFAVGAARLAVVAAAAAVGGAAVLAVGAGAALAAGAAVVAATLVGADAAVIAEGAGVFAGMLLATGATEVAAAAVLLAAAGATVFCATGADVLGAGAVTDAAAGAELVCDSGAAVLAASGAAPRAWVAVAADGAVIVGLLRAAGAVAGFTPWWAQATKPSAVKVATARIFNAWRVIGRSPRGFVANYSTSKWSEKAF